MEWPLVTEAGVDGDGLVCRVKPKASNSKFDRSGWKEKAAHEVERHVQKIVLLLEA